MFQEKGDYYCINGCFSYPVEFVGVKSFIENLSGINKVDHIVCYDIHPNKFSYQEAMDDGYTVKEGDSSLLETTTLLSLDFFYFDLPCQLQVLFWDEYYYSLSLVYSAENSISEEKIFNLKNCFYSFLNPIYGNDGYEKWIISLKDVQKNDYSILDSNFYISEELFNRMRRCCFKIKNDTVTTLRKGIYFKKQNKEIQKVLFRSFYSTIKTKTGNDTRDGSVVSKN